MSHLAKTLAVLAVAAFLLAACSKAKLPETMNAVPADADVVATLDAKALLAYAKTAVTKAVPPEMKDQIPPFEVLAKQAMDMVGIDLNKLSRVTFIGYMGSEDKMAIVAEGVDAKTLKGEKKGEHNGVALYAMPEKVHYAPLKGLGVVAGPNPEILKSVLDANLGKSKRLSDSERAKIMGKLLGQEKDLDQLRIYLLTGDFPEAGTAPFKIKGGGFFAHLDRGIAGTVLSDEKGADEIKRNLDMGLMAMQLAMAGGGGKGMPVELDKETQKVVGDIMKNVHTSKTGTAVSVKYKGDLKPLIEKAVALGMKQAQQEMGHPSVVTDKPLARAAEGEEAQPAEGEKPAPAKDTPDTDKEKKDPKEAAPKKK
jgi:hypothetical protein